MRLLILLRPAPSRVEVAMQFGWEFWGIVFFVAAAGHVITILVMTMKTPPNELRDPPGWVSYVVVLYFLALVVVGFGLLGMEEAAYAYLAFVVAMLLCVPVGIVSTAYRRGLMKGLAIAEMAWRQTTHEDFCGCPPAGTGKSPTRLKPHRHDCQYWKLANRVERSLRTARVFSKDDSVDEEDRKARVDAGLRMFGDEHIELPRKNALRRAIDFVFAFLATIAIVAAIAVGWVLIFAVTMWFFDAL